MLGKFIHDSYAGEWYNGQWEQTPEYIGNKVSMLVGMPRLRQLRIEEGKDTTTSIVLVAFRVLTCGIREFLSTCQASFQSIL